MVLLLDIVQVLFYNRAQKANREGELGRPKKAFFLVLPVLCVVGAGCQDLETYIRKNYLAPHPAYTFAPAHRYRALGPVDVRVFVPRPEKDPTDILINLSLADGLFSVRYDFVADKLSCQKLDQTKDPWVRGFYGLVSKALGQENEGIARDIIFDELIRTKTGDFVFCSYEKLNIASADLKPEDMYRPRSLWHGFCLIRGTTCLLSEVKVTEEDPETDGGSLALWDVFPFQGRECILVFNRVFERHDFEVYEVTGAGLERVLKFNFGGL